MPPAIIAEPPRPLLGDVWNKPRSESWNEATPPPQGTEANHPVAANPLIEVENGLSNAAIEARPTNP